MGWRQIMSGAGHGGGCLSRSDKGNWKQSCRVEPLAHPWPIHWVIPGVGCLTTLNWVNQKERHWQELPHKKCKKGIQQRVSEGVFSTLHIANLGSGSLEVGMGIGPCLLSLGEDPSNSVALLFHFCSQEPTLPASSLPKSSLLFFLLLSPEDLRR